MSELARARGFSGGLALRPFKALSTQLPIATVPPPPILVLAMQQHAGPPAEPTVVPGQSVAAGQTVGAARHPGAVAVHTAAAGLVTAIEERLVPSGSGLVATRCVVIETFRRDASRTAHVPPRWPADRTQRLERLRDGGIVGLGGAGFPTDVKLAREHACETLIINGAECEPYISCDDMLMRERAQNIVDGAAFMLELLDAPRCIIAVESDKSAALTALDAALRETGDPRFELVGLPTLYPAGGEKQLVESLLGREIPRSGLPIDIGVLCHNVGTAAAVADLVNHGRPLTSRIVTVTGHGLNAPQNVEAPIGTSIHELLDFCGGLRSDAAQLIIGGNMMGYAVPTDDIPVTKATNCVIALAESERWIRSEPWACIRCGECATACPARLQPQELLRSIRNRDCDDLITRGLDECIDCGCCDVVCPSHIPITVMLREGKRSLARFRAHRDRAATAEARHVAHVARERQEAHARALEQSQLTHALSADDASRRAAIEAAIARARIHRDSKTEG